MTTAAPEKLGAPPRPALSRESVISASREWRARFYRWAAWPGDRWENPTRHVQGWVVGFDRGDVKLEIADPADGVNTTDPPPYPVDPASVTHVRASDSAWKPLP